MCIFIRDGTERAPRGSQSDRRPSSPVPSAELATLRREVAQITDIQATLEARFEERYRRVAPDAISVQYTLYDPTYYATPWVGDLKPWRRMPKAFVTHVGWFGLYSGVTEAICAPMNEEEFHLRNEPAYAN